MRSTDFRNLFPFKLAWTPFPCAVGNFLGRERTEAAERADQPWNGLLLVHQTGFPEGFLQGFERIQLVCSGGFV